MKLTSARHPENQPVREFGPDDVVLPEGLYMRLEAYCRSCGGTYTYNGELAEFSEDMSYCGRSYRCIP